LAAALLVAGCGASSGPHLSPAAYKRQGDAICGRYQTAIHKLGQPTKLGDIGPFITRALPILTHTVGDLGRLHPPADREGDFGRFLTAARATVTRAQALRAAAAKADAAEVQRLLKEAATASSQRAALARKAGLDTCALS
jgi:hypothetical protein